MNLLANEVRELAKVIEDNNLSIAEVIERIQGKKVTDEQPKNDEIVLSVDYSRSLQEMIAVGNYDWKNSDIVERNFPLLVELKGKTTIVFSKLFHFGRSIGSYEVISEINKAGYRPATLAELLALGEKQPELQHQFPLIALGSIRVDAYGSRYVPYLRVLGSKRKLALGWFDDDWDVRCRFLAVSK